MAIFNNTAFTPVVEQSEEELIERFPGIMATAEGAYEIACEGSADMYRLLAGLYAADVMIEQSVSEGATDVEAVVEGTLKEFASKVKAKFIEWRDKIVAWFKKILDNLKIRFSSSKDFVEKYESRILEKAKNVKEFKPKHHDFNTDISGEVKAVGKAMVEYAKSVADKKISAGDGFVPAMIKATGYKAQSVGELKEQLKEKMVGKEIEGTAINANTVTKMVKYCKSINVATAELTAIRDANVAALNKIISEIDQSGKSVEIIKAKTANYNIAVSAMTQLNAVAVGLVNMINKEYVGILRALMLVKTESATDDETMLEDTNTESSIFESAMNMI